MPQAEPQELLRIGPCIGIDATTAGPYVDPNNGTPSPNMDPTRQLGVPSTARGRINLATFSNAAQPSYLASFQFFEFESTFWELSIASFPGATDPMQQYGTNGIFTVTNGLAFTYSAQYGNVLYTNAGQQLFGVGASAASSAYDWQYPAPAYSVTLGTTAGTLPAGTYYYTFTRSVSNPNGTQETSPDESAFAPFTNVITTGTAEDITITLASGAWSGTNADGSTWTTNIYRMSAAQPTWLFLANVTGSSPYTDSQTDEDIASNVQLDFYHDPPPTGGAIFSHKGRMFVFTLVNPNAVPSEFTLGAQCQLWYSDYGIPWSFNAAYQVLLVNQETIPDQISTAGNPGNLPVAGVSMQSVGVIFQTRTTSVLYGDDETTFVVRKVADIGCVSAKSVSLCQSFVFWLSEEGIYYFDGYDPPQLISEKIRGALQNIPISDQQNSQAWFSDRAYWISFPATGVTYAYYIPAQQWFGPLPYATPAAYSIPAQNGLAGTARLNQVTALRNAVSTSCALDAWGVAETDLGSNVTGTWNSPITDSKAPGFQKRYQKIVLNAPIQPITATVTFAIDPGWSATSTKQWSWTVDLSKGPTATWTIPDGEDDNDVLNDANGFLAQLTVELPSTGTQPGVLWSAAVIGTINREYVPFDNGAVVGV